MSFLNKKPQPTREEVLGLYPSRGDHIIWNHTKDDEVTIRIPRLNTWWIKIFSRVPYLPEERTIILDAIGAKVWELCDGKHSVAHIRDDLARCYNLHPREAEVSLLQYLQQLNKKRLVGYLWKKRSKKNALSK